MKTKTLSLILIISILFPLYVTAEKQLTGRQIAEMVDKANSSKIGIVSKGVLILKDLKSGDVEKRRFTILSVKDKGLKRMLFRFTDSSYKGTTFLTIEKPNGDKLQYLFLKSVGSPRQVEASDKENSFVDTDIANEDMGGIDINDYNYKRLKDRKLAGKDCYVIERYPKYKGSKYKKHLIFIDKETLLPLAVKSYSKQGRVIKTIRLEDIRKIGKDIYTAFKMIITNIPDKHQTIVQLTEAKEQRINRGLFNKNRMSRKWPY